RRRAGALIALAAALVAVVVVLAAGSSGSSRSAGANGSTAASTTKSKPPHGRKTASAVGGPSRTVAVPILMYHVIAAPPTGAPFPGLYVSPQEFAAQMQALKDAGWHAVTQDQVASYWRSGTPLGAGKPVVVSFDNGYQSQYTKALPVLQRLGWVGVENIQLSGLPPSQGGLGEAEIRGL